MLDLLELKIDWIQVHADASRDIMNTAKSHFCAFCLFVYLFIFFLGLEGQRSKATHFQSIPGLASDTAVQIIQEETVAVSAFLLSWVGSSMC